MRGRSLFESWVLRGTSNQIATNPRSFFIYPSTIIKTKTMEKIIEQEIAEFNRTNVFCGKSENGYGNTYFAKRNFKKGELVLKGFGRIVNRQTSTFSLQIDLGRHIIPKKWTGKYLNHSCSPNMHIITNNEGFPNFIALANIKKGKEISYAYSMSEQKWLKIAKEYKATCMCQAKNCSGKILSFSQLSETEKKELKTKKYLSKYLY